MHLLDYRAKVLDLMLHVFPAGTSMTGGEKSTTKAEKLEPAWPVHKTVSRNAW